MNQKQLWQMLQKTKVVRPPKRRLATFGTSRINYHLVTEVPGLPDRSRLRTGVVIAEKPAIITPETLKELFVGFSSEASKMADSLVNRYGAALRGLEYQFRNEPASTQIELKAPDQYIQELADRLDKENQSQTALIQGTDKAWELALMKFIVEETMSSFASNVQELQERGFFEGDKRESKRRNSEIQSLLQRAKSDKSLIPLVGSKLKSYGLFEKYQDAFFRLINQ